MHSQVRIKRFTESLPSIPCTPEMRRAFVTLSDKDQASLTQVLRTGLQHYLEHRKVRIEDTDTASTKVTASEP